MEKDKPKKKKLVLGKSTLVSLDPIESAKVVGGDDATSISFSYTCCRLVSRIGCQTRDVTRCATC